MKKQSNLSRLLEYDGSYRVLACLSWVLAALQANGIFAHMMKLQTEGQNWTLSKA